MPGLTDRKFLYHRRNQTLILFKARDELSAAYQNPAALNIARHTANTWQRDRGFSETLDNTVQGKIVEEMFEDYIFSQRRGLRYTGYDSFRDDGCRKHAPIDGLLYRQGNGHVSAGIGRILRDVGQSPFGKLTEETFQWLREHGVYTVEIKSSRIPDRDYPERSPFNAWETQDQIIANLRRRDFFLYPRYTREAGRRIHSFQDYVTFVAASRPEVRAQPLPPAEYILRQERRERCDLYTRIFVDRTHTENLIAYMLGYALREDFFTRPRIINMPRRGKSEAAIYYVFPIAESGRIDGLFTDSRLWPAGGA